jgi:hypothetical protein
VSSEIVIRSTAWQAQDFGSGCAGLRNMPAKASVTSVPSCSKKELADPPIGSAPENFLGFLPPTGRSVQDQVSR